MTFATYLRGGAAFVLVAALQACSSLDSGAEARTNTADTLSQLTWQNYDDAEAAQYAKRCRSDFNMAVAQFRNIVEQRYSDKDFLLVVNRFDITVDRVASLARLYHNVHPNSALRDAAGECEQKVTSLMSEVRLSVPIYSRLKQVKTQPLDVTTKRFVERMLEDFELSGVNKNDSTRAQIAGLNDEIVRTGQRFSQHIREDIRSVLAEPDELKGLPQDFIDAHPVNAEGLVELTTRYPDYMPVMQYAESDDLRYRLYKAFRQRGFPANRSELQKLLSQRYAYSQLLGFNSFAEYISTNKMIKTPENAQAFIDKVSAIAAPSANADRHELLQRLQQIDPDATEVTDWQKTYLENLVRSEVYEVDAQRVREYFAYERVKKGVFQLVESLFNVQIVPWQTEVWHPSVEAWQIMEQGNLVGQFYLDMHPRDGKYSHAASFGIRTGVKGVQTPINALVCNFPGGEGEVGLMEHNQVETFLHEFGHLLHDLFGGHQPWLALSGVATEWDFVEAPSQMLEEWVWDARTLKTFARNAKGEVIPDELIAKMNASRGFGKGLWTTQQMYYAALSLNYYNRPATEVNLLALETEMAARYAPFAHVDDTYFYASFGHLNGYSAIYYTYMWSLAIAADMFSEFERQGLHNSEVAARYRHTVLAPGGSKDAAELVQDFLGRPYSIDAFAKTLNDK